MSGNVTPARIAVLFNRSIMREYDGNGLLTKILHTIGSDLFVRSRFSRTELVTRETQNDETLVFVLLVEGLQTLVLGCEAAGEMHQRLS